MLETKKDKLEIFGNIIDHMMMFSEVTEPVFQRHSGWLSGGKERKIL